MIVVDRKRKLGNIPALFGKYQSNAKLECLRDKGHTSIYSLHVPAEFTNERLSIMWKMPAVDVKGSWSPGLVLDKRFRTDWEVPQLESSISMDAPVISLFGHQDENVICIACSDTIHHLSFEASLREEDNNFYMALHLFTEVPCDHDYNTLLRIDKSDQQFSHAISEAGAWIIDADQIEVQITPKLAKSPLYSTWYSFHQDLNETELLGELTIAKSLGCKLVIIDDGWQTNDNNRGYDYTGDWKSERFYDMKDFVGQVHELGMGIMLWYSVPFCGRKSEAYRKFKGKFLTENHHWAPVFDPRFPEVRDYLKNIYVQALLNWDIDGFKLDFIDDFKVYPETETRNLNGRDTIDVTEGVWKLLQEIRSSLQQIKPDLLVEFRQRYVNPKLRHLGNMFRAFDCPNDSLMNRVRITDLKLLCGSSAPHSDMITWHKNSKIETAALQMTSALFAVPQISVRLNERREEELEMLRFYLKYWNENRTIFLNGHFTASNPMANYPVLSAYEESKMIYGVYDELVVEIDPRFSFIDIINGKLSESIFVRTNTEANIQICQITDCLGNIINHPPPLISGEFIHLQCPPNGIVSLKTL